MNEQNTDEITTQKPLEDTPLKKIRYITDSGIYVISKNWDQTKLDSLLLSSYDITIITEDATFVTQYCDTINLVIEKIKRSNPVIIFNELDGPIITSFDNLHRFIPSPIQTNNINSDSNKYNINEQTQEAFSDETTLIIENKRSDIPPIRSLSDTLTLPQNSRLLEENYLGTASKPYPLIPDKKSLEIYFDNDFWDYTDYYYTNGIRLGYTHPVFANSPLSYLLVSNATNGLDYYGMHLVQHMYTGSQPKVDTTIPGDRPWASYSIIGQYATSFDWEKKIKHESEINIGILGPKSGGGFLQDLVHTILPNNSPPEGWHNQINTDIIIDFQYRIYSSLYESKNFESYIKASIQGGTLRDNIKWGTGLKYGVFTPFYKDYQNQVYNKTNRKIYYSIFGVIETQLIGYDATLQGGVTDRTSIYVIPTRNMERFIIQGYVGMEFTYKRMQLQFIQYWKSKEFKTGKDHKYVSVRLFIGF